MFGIEVRRVRPAADVLAGLVLELEREIDAQPLQVGQSMEDVWLPEERWQQLVATAKRAQGRL